MPLRGKHADKEIREWFVKNNVVVLHRPYQSPDLSSIKNI